MFAWISKLFSTDGFPKRWECGPAWREQPEWGWLSIGSDVAIWGAYVGIPMVLLYFAWKRRDDVPYLHIWWLFGAFILACGTTHLIEAIVFYEPVYRLAAVVKLLTALVSWGTVFALAWVVPVALTFRSPAELEREVGERTADLERLTRRLQREVAARAAAEDQLRERDERLRLALRAGRMGSWEWKTEEGACLLDETECELLGIPHRGRWVPDEEFFRLVHPDDVSAVRKSTEESLHEFADYDVEFRVRRPDGETRWLAGRGTMVTATGEAERRMVGVNFDVTDQKEFEESLRVAQEQADAANLAKSEFLAHTSHEIRTPLTAILGGAEALAGRLEDEELRELATTIGQEGRVLLEIVNDILDLSRIEAGRLELRVEKTSLKRLIDDVASLFRPRATSKGLDFEVRFDTPIPRTCRTDPLRLRQVLLNLIGNAIKFTDRGHVHLRVRCVPDGDQMRLVCSVEDTGMGIPPDRLEAIFNAFEQAHGPVSQRLGGAGLGLAIGERLARMLGGRLDVESEVGKGSRFTLDVPLGPSPTMEMVPAESIETPRDGESETPVVVERLPGRVLVAEDTRGIRLVLRRMLEDLVEEVRIVDDGERAVEEMRAAVEAGRPYDLLLMDMRMPVLDGFEATARLRARGFATPIVALTAAAMAQDRERCLAAGCTDYLSKPVDRAELVALLTRFLGERAETR